MNFQFADEALDRDPKSAAGDSMPNSHVYGNNQTAASRNTVNRHPIQMMAGDIGLHRDRKSPGHTLASNANKLSADDSNSCWRNYSTQVQA